MILNQYDKSRWQGQKGKTLSRIKEKGRSPEKDEPKLKTQSNT